MSRLLSLAPEVLNGVFQELNPEDLASLSKTCHLLNIFVKNDRLLWKHLYLRNYDHLFLKPGKPEPEWQAELKKIVVLKKLLESSDSDVKRENLASVATTVVDLISTASAKTGESLNVAFLASAFQTQMNIDTFLCSSSLFKNAGPTWSSPAPTPEARQLSAKLHVLYGLAVEPFSDATAVPIHPTARSKVYDLRSYNDHNFWGPFLSDGTGAADWEKLQSIMVVLSYNLRAFTERTHNRYISRRDEPFLGSFPNSFVAEPTCPAHAAAAAHFLIKDPSPPALAAQDPYGVTGTWRRVVCFLNYTDLYEFNFTPGDPLPPAQERPPIDIQEAIRLITLKIRVCAVGPPDEDAGDHPDFPVVSFKGSSRSMHTSWDPNANSRIRGTVRMTKEGEVRWTSFSIYHGEERWRSEGVQVGGLRSARGVLGTWFDKDYDEHGPAGPTAFWKLSDHIEEDKPQVGGFVWA